MDLRDKIYSWARPIVLSLFGIGFTGSVHATVTGIPDSGIFDMLNRMQKLNSARPEQCDPRLLRASSGAEDNRFAGQTLPSAFNDKNADCSLFINSQGEYGPSGVTISNALKTDSRLSHLVSDGVAKNATIKSICPGFMKMNREERIHFWVWTHASIALEESTCGREVVNPRNSEAVGLFQMERSKSTRSWRGPHCAVKSVMPQAGARDPHEKNTMCALDVMLGQFKGTYGKPPGLWPNSYYLKLRGSWGGDFSRGILKRVRLHPGCTNSKTTEMMLKDDETQKAQTTQPEGPEFI